MEEVCSCPRNSKIIIIGAGERRRKEKKTSVISRQTDGGTSQGRIYDADVSEKGSSHAPSIDRSTAHTCLE